MPLSAIHFDETQITSRLMPDMITLIPDPDGITIWVENDLSGASVTVPAGLVGPLVSALTSFIRADRQ